jgi:hypothetical protein
MATLVAMKILSIVARGSSILQSVQKSEYVIQPMQGYQPYDLAANILKISLIPANLEQSKAEVAYRSSESFINLNSFQFSLSALNASVSILDESSRHSRKTEGAIYLLNVRT